MLAVLIGPWGNGDQRSGTFFASPPIWRGPEMSEPYDEEISPAELEEFDYLLLALKGAGVTTVSGLDVLTGFSNARDDWNRFRQQQRERERRASWRPRHQLRAALPPGTITKELGDLTVKELLEIEVSLDELIELRRRLGEGRR